MLGETSARRAIHSALNRPGFGCGSSVSFAEHQFAHSFEIMQRGFVSQMAQRLAHFGECEFGLITQAEKRLGASHFLACARYFQNFIGSHGVCAGLARIAAEGAIAAVVATKIGEGDKDFARIANDAWLKILPCRHGSCE